MPQERWLVTGGAGFIGSHIAEDLVRRGHRVRILDDLSSGKLERIAPFSHKVEFVKGDLRDLAAVRRVMKGVQYVSHQGGLRAVAKSMVDPVSYSEVNVTGTVHVLLAAKEAGARRVVFASSSSVYGNDKRFPQRESQPPAPVSPYAASKVSAEHFLSVFNASFGVETVALRYFNVYGPRQDLESQYAVVVPKFMVQALRGEPLEVHWDGKQSRDFSHIANVVHANWLAAHAAKAPGRVFNVANGESHSLLDLIGVIERLCGRKLKRRHSPPRAGDVRKTWADISQARRLLGYKPPVSFEAGLEDTWDYFKANY